MAGTASGGKKATQTNKRLYGDDFYARIGAKGGRNGRDGGFGSDTVDANGLTGRDRARIYGSKGGKISKRGKKRGSL